MRVGTFLWCALGLCLFTAFTTHQIRKLTIKTMHPRPSLQPSLLPGVRPVCPHTSRMDMGV